MARVRVGAMNSETSEWIFPDFKVISKKDEGILTLKVNVTSPVRNLLLLFVFFLFNIGGLILALLLAKWTMLFKRLF